MFCLVYFAALCPKSTAMVMAGWSVHLTKAMVMAGRSVYLTTLFFLGKLEQAVNQYFLHILLLVTDNNSS